MNIKPHEAFVLRDTCEPLLMGSCCCCSTSFFVRLGDAGPRAPLAHPCTPGCSMADGKTLLCGPVCADDNHSIDIFHVFISEACNQKKTAGGIISRSTASAYLCAIKRFMCYETVLQTTLSSPALWCRRRQQLRTRAEAESLRGDVIENRKSKPEMQKFSHDVIHRDEARQNVAAAYPENLAIETLAPVGLMASAPKGEIGSLALPSSGCSASETGSGSG